MYWKIEPTGCCVVKKDIGEIAIQIRYSFFLNESDINYHKYLIDEYILSGEHKFPQKSEKVFTGRKILVPIHNHIINIPFDSSDEFIKTIGDQLLNIVKEYDSLGYFDSEEIVHIPNTLCHYDNYTTENESIANTRLIQIKTNLEWL